MPVVKCGCIVICAGHQDTIVAWPCNPIGRIFLASRDQLIIWGLGRLPGSKETEIGISDSWSFFLRKSVPANSNNRRRLCMTHSLRFGIWM